MTRFFGGLILAALGVVPTVQAAVSSVQGSPSGAPVEMANNTSLVMGWFVSSTASGTITSKTGVFRTRAGKVLGTTTQVLRASLTGAGDIIVPETVVVPANVAVRAQLLGDNDVIYERVFGDGAGDGLGAISLHIAESARGQQRLATNNSAAGAGSFEASRLSLSVGDHPFAEIGRGQKIIAKAKVHYSSNGIFDATWQVVGPDAGKDVSFRALSSVNQLLADSGDVTFESPKLPSDAAGVYRVRLQVTTPALRFEEPEIRYIVKSK